MHITYKGDYALKAVLDLALNYGNGVVTIHDLAFRLDIPLKFLEQILLDLKKGGFLESRRGKVGGYFLAKPPGRIKLGEIIRFIDGPVEPIACASLDKKYQGCNDIHKCVFRKIWGKLARMTSEIIDRVTFEDLVAEIKAKKKEIVYSI